MEEKKHSLDRLKNILACPTCKGDLVRGRDKLTCRSCGMRYLIHEGCPIFLEPEADFTPTSNISRNPYTGTSLSLIEKYENGIILDDGAGYPLDQHNFDHVVQLEIVKYPTTDVVGNGLKLPFKSDSFDAVLSEAVLEHVQDPFTYVSEIYRVLKPGGEVYIDSAFMQPVHAYPCHYFNTTLLGLQYLFRDFEITQSGVGGHQMPWITLGWVLNSYANGFVDSTDKEIFLSKSVADLLNELPQEAKIDFYNRLDEGSVIELACGVNVFGKKPCDDIKKTSCAVPDLGSKSNNEVSLSQRCLLCYKKNGAAYTCKRIIDYLKAMI